MPLITSSATPILDSAGRAVNGLVYWRQTSRFVSPDGLVTVARGLARVADGVISSATGGPLRIPETPEGQAVEIVEDFGDGSVRWVTSVPATDVEYHSLPYIELPTGGADIPDWVQDVLDTPALIEVAVGQVAADRIAAEAARDAAQAVGATNDGVVKGLLDNPASMTSTTLQTQMATAIAGSAPTALNTLAKVATALSGDANFASSQASALLGKAPVMLPESGVLLAKLMREQSDATLVVLGDSTGQGNTTTTLRWVYRLGTSLGAMFPAYTVRFLLWNNTTTAYDTPTTLHTGTGSRVLTIYNGSASGMSSSYSTTYLATMAPVAPDLTFINHGHNESPATMLTNYPALLLAFRSMWPKSPVVLIAQNPATTADAVYAEQLAIRQTVAEIATHKQLGFVDIATPFLLYPSWETALMGDTKHPNSVGSQLWADAVARQLTYSPYAQPRMSSPGVESFTVPAASFGPWTEGGSAATAPTYGSGVMWSFDPATAQSVVAPIDIPYWWNSWTVYLDFTCTSAVSTNAGTVMWQLWTAPIPDGTSGFPLVSPTFVAITDSYRPVAVASDGQNKIHRAQYLPAAGYGTKGPHRVKVFRFANNASDTLAISCQFLSLRFVRVD